MQLTQVAPSGGHICNYVNYGVNFWVRCASGNVFTDSDLKVQSVENGKIPAKKLNIARGTTDPEIDSITWIKLGKNMAPLTLVANLATSWRHLHGLQIWPPDGATCISCKFVHQMALLALVIKLATRLYNLHCHIALDCPIGIIS